MTDPLRTTLGALTLALAVACAPAADEAVAEDEQTTEAAPAEDAIDPCEDMPSYAPETYETPRKAGLQVGDPIPEICLIDHDGEQIPLATACAERPLIVIFIQGGYCPNCNRDMKAWQFLIDEVEKAGGFIIAITGQKPEYIDHYVATFGIEYPFFCDADGDLARAFKVQQVIDDPRQQESLARTLKFRLPDANADERWTLPGHATFILGTDGTIRYANARWTMASAEPKDVLDALREIVAQDADTPDHDAPAD